MTEPGRNTPAPSDYRGSRARRRHPRGRRGDRVLLTACSVVAVASVLAWTGVVPCGLYPSSPARWSFEVSTCTTNATYVQHGFPLWATVHLQWTAQNGDVWYMVQGRGLTYLSETGTNGSGSFVSDSYPLAFWALSLVPVNSSRCSPIFVNTTATYTV